MLTRERGRVLRLDEVDLVRPPEPEPVEVLDVGFCDVIERARALVEPHVPEEHVVGRANRHVPVARRLWLSERPSEHVLPLQGLLELRLVVLELRMGLAPRAPPEGHRLVAALATLEGVHGPRRGLPDLVDV